MFFEVGNQMIKKHLITTVIAVCLLSVTGVAMGASSYIPTGKLEDELPPMIIGSLSGIFLFLFVNWFVNWLSRSNSSKKPKK